MVIAKSAGCKGFIKLIGAIDKNLKSINEKMVT